ncbi:MAG: hypothetical protein IKG11_03950 [Atopobiaceae bacterium]|nr:hypothetical protein [Atopobiaceae bacterium]
MQAFEVTNESSYYYYAHNGVLTLALTMRLTLDHTIDHQAMQQALTRAAHTYPQFSSRLAYVDGRWWYVPNELDVVLYAAQDNSCSLGGPDTNHYLYRVWAEGNSVGIVASHGMGDGHCLTDFMRTLLFYYAVERGLVDEDSAPEGIFLEGQVEVPAFDPYLRYANTEQAPIGTPDIGPIFAPSVAYSEDAGDFSCHVDLIELPTAQLRDLAKRVQARISPLVMALEARAIAQAWDTAGASLIGPITYDMRPYFETGMMDNFSSWALAVLPGQVLAADLATQCAVIAQAMEQQLNVEAMRVQMGRSIANTAAERGKSLDELFSSTERHMEEARYTRKYLSLYVSNVGALRLPEPLAQMLVSAECYLPSFSSPINLTMMGTPSTVRISITRTFDDDGISRAMLAQLQEQGIDARLELRGRQLFPRMGREAVLELERI